MRHIMAVYDVDPFYAVRFADVVNQREKIPFEVVAFTSLEKLKAFARETPVELLLISGAVNREEAESVGAGRLLVLADGETLPAEGEYPCIYKYQSSDDIIREVMACYCERSESFAQTAVQTAAQIIGVFSPVGRCLKTSLAIALGRLLSQEEKTLYVNLEECSGLSALTGTEYRAGLSDLLYYYGEGNYNRLRLSSTVYSMGELDYIPPARYPEDLEQAGPEAVAGLLRRVADEGGYKTLVVDAGGFRKTALSVLELCSVIYMPIKEDSVSLAKLEEFDAYLEKTGNLALKERIRKLRLPFHSSFGRKDNYLEQLLWGELGDYARQLLRGGTRK